MKVILISSRYDAFGEAKFSDRLGVMSLAAFLEANHVQVEIIDALYNDLSLDDLEKIVLKSMPDIVGVSCYAGSRTEDFKVIKMVKKVNPKIVTVLGGPQATTTAEEILRNIQELDFLVQGEGELTLLELCKNIEESKEVHSIQGIAYLKDSTYIQNPPRQKVQDLDTLPFTARHLHPKYASPDSSRLFYTDKAVGIYDEKFSSVHVMATRGCPYNCLFCSTTSFWRNKTRFRSIENVVKEMELLKNSFGVNSVNFADDTLNIDINYLFSLCTRLVDKKLDFTWQCNFRANAIVNKEILIKMKEAGCTGIRMGVESGSPRILKQVKKGVTKEQVRNIAKWCDEIGLGRRLNFIISFPGETFDEAKRTVEFAKEFGEPYLVNPLVIYPGTQVEAIAKKNGCLPENFSWTDPHPHLKYSLPGRITDIPMFIDKIPFNKVTDLIFQIESERKKFFSLSKRLKEIIRNINSLGDVLQLLSWSNFVYLFKYLKFRFFKFHIFHRTKEKN